MSKTKKRVVFSTCIVLVICIASCCIFVGCSKPEDKKTTASSEGITTEMIESEHVKLSAGVALAGENGLISKTIKATVLPSDAANKNVSWSMKWANTRNENVNDYLAIVSSGVDNENLTVTCKKAFPADILITCTTEQYGYEAYCVVHYVGVPTTIAVVGHEDIKLGNAYIIDEKNKSITWTINLGNPYNQVGNKYLSNLDVKLVGKGNVVLANKMGGTSSFYEDTKHTVPMSSIMNDLVSVSTSGNKVTLTVKKHLKSYYKSTETVSIGHMKLIDAFYGYDQTPGNVGYIDIVVKVPNTNLSVSISSMFDCTGPDSVTLNSHDITF